MIKSILLQFIIFPFGSFAFYYTLFSLRAPFPTFMFGTKGALVASIIASFFTWIGLNKWHGIRHIAADLAIAKKTNFEDGKRAVVSGSVKGKGPLLEAPCSGTQCVAYRYKASHRHVTVHKRDRRHETRSRWLADYKGYAMIPSEVKGSIRTVSILTEPGSIEYPEGGSDDSEIPGSDAKDRLRKYLSITDFGEEINDRLEGRDAQTKQTHYEPGNFRVDTCAKDADTITNDHQLKEMVITEGDTVLISGVYYADKNGIGPGPNSTLQPLQITQGGEAFLMAKVRDYNSSIKTFFGLAAITCAIYFLFFVFIWS